MALVSLTNQTFGGGTTGASWVWALVNLLVGSAAWTKVRDSDGTTYSATGAQVTGGGSGANGIGNTSAWVELRAPDGSLSFTIQRGANNLVWRFKIAQAPFSGGTPGATQTGSAANEGLVLGGGTDGAPTYAQLVGQSDAGGYHGQFVAETVAPYRFGGVAYQDLGIYIHTKFILDTIQGWSAATGDTFLYALHVAGGSAGGDTMNLATLTDPTSSQAAPWSWLGNPGVGTFLRVPTTEVMRDGANNVAPDGGAVNPITGAYDLRPLSYERYSGASAPRGFKGYSTSLFWRPVSTHQITDQYDVASAGAKDSILLNQVVWSLWPAGVVPTGAFAASTDRGSARLLNPATSDAVAPTIANVSPAPGTALATTQAVAFDMTDNVALRIGLVLAQFPDGTYEVVHDGTNFAARYAGSSTRTVITGGFHFVVLRATGWTQAPTFVPIAVDTAGNLNA